MSGVNYVPTWEAVLHVSYLNFIASSLVSTNLHSIDSIGRKRIKKAGKQAGRGDVKEILKQGIILRLQIWKEACRGQETRPKWQNWQVVEM